MVRLAYVTIEDISTGLFKTQVLNKLIAISRKDKNIHINIMCINRPWKIFQHIKSIYAYRKIIKNGSYNIKLTYVPVLPPLRHALRSFFYIKFVVCYLHFWLSLLQISRYELVHVRSYLPLFSLLNFKLKNIIFDPRSLWVEENISTGDLIEGSKVHNYALNTEIKSLIACNQICVVSKEMIPHYKSKVENLSINLIPISFDEDYFHFDSSRRESIREKFNFGSSTVYVYSGSFGQSGINMLPIATMFKMILKIPNSKLLVLTSESKKHISNLCNKIDSDTSKIVVLESGLEEISGYLSAADIGLHALPKQLDSSTRLGTKVVEYWACGLPILVNEYVGAAVQIIRNQRVGAVVSHNANLSEYELLTKDLMGVNRLMIKDFGVKNFSSLNIADKYLKVYGKTLTA